MIFFAWNFESFCLFNVAGLVKRTIEECSIDVYLIDFRFETCKNCEEGSKWRVFDDGCEGFVIVLLLSLGETFGIESYFIHIVILCMENPVRFDDYRIPRMWDECLYFILRNRVQFFFYYKLLLLCIFCIYCLLKAPWLSPVAFHYCFEGICPLSSWMSG